MALCQQLHTSEAPERAPASSLLNPFRGAKRTLVILSLALASCRGPALPASPTPEVVSLRLLADSATLPLLRDLTSAYHPPDLLLTWDIQAGEVSTLLNWLNTSTAPYALMDYTEDAGLDAMWSTPVGEDGIAVIVHPSTPVMDMSAGQLRAVLQGRVDNWKSLGGNDEPLTVVARSDSSTAQIIQSMVLGDRRLTQAAQLATTSQAVVDIVSTQPGAIGFVSMGYLSPNVHTLRLDSVLPTPDSVTSKLYPIRAPIIFVGPNSPGDDAYRAFFAWVQSPEGQAIVRQHYGGLEAK